MKFNEALLLINSVVVEQYPHTGFYEAQGYLIPDENDVIDGTIDTEKFKAVYRFIGQNKTLIGTLDENCKVKLEVINLPWLEDIFMTPYISMSASDAIKLIEARVDVKIMEGPITLRHQLYPGEREPRYFIGPIHTLHSIGVYSAAVDEPAGGVK